jgi:hypothetical protein
MVCSIFHLIAGRLSALSERMIRGRRVGVEWRWEKWVGEADFGESQQKSCLARMSAISLLL